MAYRLPFGSSGIGALRKAVLMSSVAAIQPGWALTSARQSLTRSIVAPAEYTSPSSSADSPEKFPQALAAVAPRLSTRLHCKH